MVHGFTVPPWIVFPDSHPGMGTLPPSAVQEYGDRWVAFLSLLTPDDREDYKRDHPEPEPWRGFYEAIGV